MGLYLPEPNPPCEPKECQGCESVIDGENTEGWWMEREAWQGPNRRILFCLSCCVEKMNEWSNYPDVADERGAIVELTTDRPQNATDRPQDATDRPQDRPTPSPDVTAADSGAKTREQSE